MSGSATPRERDLEAKLAEALAREKMLQEKVASLEVKIETITPRGSRGSSPFSSMRPGLPTGGAPAGENVSGNAGRRPLSPRPVSPRPAPRPMSPRPASPGRGSGVAFDSTLGTARKQTATFHASMRGGPLTEPMQQRGLTVKERSNPHAHIRGPSLLTRDKHGAKKSEWERFKMAAEGGGAGGNFFEDDNPFNDPFQYRPFKGLAFPPSDYIGPDDPRERDDMSDLTPNALRLAFAYGYCGRRVRNNLFYNVEGKLVYHTAALGVVYDKDTHEQLHFHGHDDDITALDIHPDRVRVATGQMGKEPKVLLWSSVPLKGGDGKPTRHLPLLCSITGDHKRAIIGLSFSSSGEYLATMGNDNNRSIALYRWGKDKSMEQMRIGIDKGHNDDVYGLAYNPVTDHVVAVGKKYIRFFGVKEGVEDGPSDSRDAKLSSHESKIWAKKGVFGKTGAADIMCVAFGLDGVTYVGAATGHIFRFAEQV